MRVETNDVHDAGPAIETAVGARHARLSVVMPVRNAMPYLDAAVTSILQQTHTDFEFVIGDDASDDGSTEALRAWAARDSRIRLFEGGTRRGPAGSSNWVVEQATGELIARMDADDLAHPDRLRRQLAALAARPDAVLIGCVATGIDGAGRPVREQPRYAIGAGGGLSAPFAHGSVMFRRDAFVQAGGYREQCAFWEDLDLYLRLERLGKLLTLPDRLYVYRFSETSTRLTSRAEQVEQSVALMLRCRRAHAKGEDYDTVLARAGPDARQRIDARVFLSIGGGQIWAGVSPRMMGRMLKRARFPRTWKDLVAWGVIAWASVSPRSARYAFRKLLAVRNRRASGQFEDGHLYEWRSLAPGRITTTR